MINQQPSRRDGTATGSSEGDGRSDEGKKVTEPDTASLPDHAPPFNAGVSRD